MTNRPDLFTNVHKGIRLALFEACSALGRAGDDPDLGGKARELLAAALRFVVQHGDNEDFLFLPLLDARAPHLAERLRLAHCSLEAEIEGLCALLPEAPLHTVYLRAGLFTAHYLEHMAEEELELEESLRAVISTHELLEAGKSAVARTEPAARETMLRTMLPALPLADRNALLAKLPPEVAARLQTTAN